MEREGDEVHLSSDEASGGSKPGILRYVLAVSLLLAIAALSAIWISGAASNDYGSDAAHQAQKQD